MLLIIPEIILKDGHCSYSINGENGTEKLCQYLSEHPIELCKLLRRENAKSIHLSDFCADFSADKSNMDFIISLSNSIDIPFQFFANFQSINECEYLLEHGIYRIVVGKLAFEKPEEVANLIKKYTPARVINYVESSIGKVNYSSSDTKIDEIEYINQVKKLGFQRILYNYLDENTDFHNIIERIKEIGTQTKIRITLYNAATKPEHLWQLNDISSYGIDSLVIGKALYNNNYPCQTIWRMIEADLEKIHS